MVVKREGPTHRQRQALATKEQIAAAGRKLFAERGYVATTITAISEAADIPVPTIYSAFGNKAAILKDITQRAVAPLDVKGRYEQVVADPDPVSGLRRAAQMQREQFETMYDVMTVTMEAVRTDPEIAEMLRGIMASRERAYRAHLETVAAHLAPAMTVDEGVDVYVTLVLPEIYHSLVVERGWSPDRYETWLGDNLIRQLLGTR
ncbi:transcriptional regulator, TetR family [Catenulispora acidiphila DSM 44928]|uniref:Transcriptional regulator, TetR family n=1 Tax=Catenulispora acidiphila (strain DSM 44928 / JCM 14897 / NBRC 102108 / NRRL B-24433 / ID139908) TaxID=479433 RepID=C7QDJ6_CATAD|nr:TetR/AcrR family transcriptional regulator [Catenulispora acidiphila]ACU74620.1 transcriptional regulator, TetR family [Catenulispora acidiphila DSM 44928]